MSSTAVLRVADSICDGIGLAYQSPPNGSVSDEVKPALVFAWAHFVNVRWLHPVRRVTADEMLTAFLELERAKRGLPRFENALLAKTFGVQTRLHFPDQKCGRPCFSNTKAIAAQSVVIATIRFDESGQPQKVVWV